VIRWQGSQHTTLQDASRATEENDQRKSNSIKFNGIVLSSLPSSSITASQRPGKGT